MLFLIEISLLMLSFTLFAIVYELVDNHKKGIKQSVKEFFKNL